MMPYNRLRTIRLNPSSDSLELLGDPSRVTHSEAVKASFIT